MSAVTPTPEEEEVLVKDPGYEFDDSFQRKIVALSLRDTTFAVRTIGLIEAQFLENEADAALVTIAQDYFKTYKKAPDKGSLSHLIKQAFRTRMIRKDLILPVRERFIEVMRTDISDRDLVIDNVEEFAKNKAMESAIITAVGMMDKIGPKDFGKMRALFTKAALVGATTDGEEYDFWNEAETRAQYRIDLMAGLIKRDGITTGITDLDKELYHHGWGRRELSLWMGAAKAGKSMSLGFFAKQASLAGFNVLYASCEVSRAIISERIEADVSDTIIKLVGDNPHAVLAAVQKARKGAGQFKIHEYASGGLKPSELRRLIERYRMKGVVFDLIAVDYADIMAPERTNDSQIENMRTIYVDLRGIAFDYNVAMLTATQTNREGAKKAVAKMTDVAEDFNKIRTADIVLSINATEPERLAGECRIFFAASRNSEDGFVIRVKQDRSRMRFISKVIGKEAA